MNRTLVELMIATRIPLTELQQYDPETLATIIDVLEQQHKAQHG